MDDDDLMAQAADLNRSFEGTDLFGAGGGGVAFEATSSIPAIEFGKKVVLVNRPCDLCFGLIHGGQRICLAGAECQIVSHQAKGKKYVPTVVEPFLMVSGPSGRNNTSTAYINPVLPTSLLEDDLKSSLLESESDDIGAILSTVWEKGIRHAHELESMIEAPKTVKRLINEIKSPANVTQRQQVEDILKKLGTIQGNLISEFSAQIPSDFMNKLKELSSSDPEFSTPIEETIKYLSIAMEKLTKAVKGCMQSITLHTNLRSDEIAKLKRTTNEINSSIEHMSSSLGKRSADAAGITEPSLWSFASSTRTTQEDHKGAISGMLQTLSAMGSQIKMLQTRLDNIQSPPPANPQGNAEAQYFGASANPLKSNPSGSDGRNLGRAIENGILRPLSSRGGGAYASGSDLEGIRVTSGGDYFGHTDHPMDGNGPGGNGSGHDGNGPNDPPFDGGGSNRGGFPEVWSVLDNHEKRIHNLELVKRGDGTQSVHWKGRTFNEAAEISALFDKYVGTSHIIKFGCFANPYQLLDECTRRLTSHFKTTKEIKEILALQLRGIEVRSYLSLDSGCNLPYLFSTAERLVGFTYLTKPNKTIDARFQGCPSSTDFATLEDTKGIYPAIMRALKTVRIGIERDVELHYGKFPVIQNLANQMLGTSVTFVEELLAFMSQTHAALLKSFKGDDKAWECVCKAVEDIWASQIVPATVDMNSADLADRRLFSILCMWTSLKVTAAAENISANKISSHPDVTSSYVRFLIDHVGASQSSALSEAMAAISDLRTELANTRKELNIVKGQVNSCESRVDKLNSKNNKK